MTQKRHIIYLIKVQKRHIIYLIKVQKVINQLHNVIAD